MFNGAPPIGLDMGVLMNTDVDLFVIGVGSGGVRAARMSAAYGARWRQLKKSLWVVPVSM